ENWNIDVDGARKVIENTKPKIVTLGFSLYLFPNPTKEISEIAHSVGAKVVHDVAHVLGLITGKQWRNPLEEGADLITSSTHKTFPGPQGGLIATRSEEDYKTIGRIVFPMFVSNHHLHRLAGVAVTGLEMKYWGVEYARQIIRNAKTLAESLAEQGFKVVAENRGFTESHQVVLDVRKQGGGSRVAELFEKANIIVNKNLLPWDKPEDIKNPSGIRIGVQEVTRWGMKESDMKQIAEFMRMVAIDNKDPEDVKKKVIDFRKDFNKVHYGFDIDSEDELKLLKIMLHGGE
ncbi:MAG: aminotransferase class I/II-fold pyridoxal phosphate-dependent enzyme, partial [Desulfurococcaceae archaeon]